MSSLLPDAKIITVSFRLPLPCDLGALSIMSDAEAMPAQELIAALYVIVSRVLHPRATRALGPSTQGPPSSQLLIAAAYVIVLSIVCYDTRFRAVLHHRAGLLKSLGDATNLPPFSVQDILGWSSEERRELVTGSASNDKFPRRPSARKANRAGIAMY